MPQLPINESFVATITVVANSQLYWLTVNPIIQKLNGAYDTDSKTIRIGDGTTRYKDLTPITYIGTSGVQPMVDMATENNPGVVSNLASDSDITNGTGTGVIMAKQISLLVTKLQSAMSISNVQFNNIGDRDLKPWLAPREGWRVLNGQYIDPSDQCYALLNEYIGLHPDEVVTPQQYSDLSTTAGGVGGVFYYTKETDGRIRLPDARGDSQRAYGYNGLNVGDWHDSDVKSHKHMLYGSNSSGSINIRTSLVGASNGTIGTITTTKANDITTAMDNTGGIETRTRGSNWLPVVYVGIGQNFISENGMIYLEKVASKHIGEVFKYDGISAPAGAIQFNGATYSRTTYAPLFKHIVDNNKIKTELEWQTEFTNNNGNVDFYSYTDNPELFRVPVYNKDDRNWLTDSILCVQAYHALINQIGIDLNIKLTDVFNDVEKLKVTKKKIAKSLRNTRGAAILMNDLYTVPEYTVGYNQLSVYLNGALCIEGTDMNYASYAEYGIYGSKSTIISWLQNIPIDYDIVVIVE